MKRALIRLEDLGPGASYGDETSLTKLRAVADYLYSEQVPFHVAVIPRFVNPGTRYDKSIGDTSDSFIQLFDDTLRYLKFRGGFLCMEGYTHQYNQVVSGDGPEFYDAFCTGVNCPPDDPPGSCEDESSLVGSWAASRIQGGFDAYERSGITFDGGWITPEYTASPTQMCILQSYTGLFYQDPPAGGRMLTILDTDEPFYRGTVFVPTPLGYVLGTNPQQSVNAMCAEITGYSGNDLASFFYHAYLEFPFIQITADGIVYDDNSYLKQLVRCFKQQGFTFTSIYDVTNFVPSTRVTSVFPTSVLQPADVNGDGKQDILSWVPSSGTWCAAVSQFTDIWNRLANDFTKIPMLCDWAVGDYWVPLVGDFNGDGKDDVVVWDKYAGDWQVALSDGTYLVPSVGRGDYSWLRPWAIGTDWEPFVGDFNGDGLDDIVVWNVQTGDWQVALSSGTEFVPSSGRGDYSWLRPWAIGKDEWSVVVADVNGDGRTDLVVRNVPTGNWQVGLSDGTQFVPSAGRGDYIWLEPWAVGTEWTVRSGDVNGDGREDIIVVNPTLGDWQVALSSGAVFEPIPYAFAPWAAGPEMEPLVADFTGDGTADLCARQASLRGGTLDFAASGMSGTV